MDGYDALRLTKGGGLTAGTMKPAGDGLHLFLGLGGTGIECLRTLKTRVREWLALSELAEAPFSLFGIDTDDYSRTAGEFLLPLEEKEFLWFRYPGNLGPHLRDRTDLAWLPGACALLLVDHFGNSLNLLALLDGELIPAAHSLHPHACKIRI